MSIVYFFEQYGAKLVSAIITHIQYVIISVAIGFTIAFILAILLSRIPSVSKYVIPIVGVFQTIPGLIFIGVLYMYTGMNPITIIIALSIYALFPILKNTYTGLLSVDPAMIEAARGCGMSNMQILYKVEIPLSVNSIFSGLRMSTIYTVNWAVLAAMIGLGGLGEFIYRGIETNNTALIIGGAIPAAILAIILGLLIDLVRDKITPRGMKGGN